MDIFACDENFDKKEYSSSHTNQQPRIKKLR